MSERHIKQVPVAVWLLLISGLCAQLIWQAYQVRVKPSVDELIAPPTANVIRLFSMGEEVTAARLLDLWLQAHDNQPGVSIPLNQLDYDRVQAWLETILQLDPGDRYPMMVASHVYSRVNDQARTRKMLEFIHQQFELDPRRHWRWLAHGAIVAKHRLKDLPLALKYANSLAEKAGQDIPYWARDIRLAILEDMGEHEAVKILIGGLLAKGEISDIQEIHFLESKLKQLEGR